VLEHVTLLLQRVYLLLKGCRASNRVREAIAAILVLVSAEAWVPEWSPLPARGWWASSWYLGEEGE